MSNHRSYTFEIKSQDVDFQHNATMMCIGNFLLAVADSNANDRGFGITYLNQNQCTWALLRFAIEMEQFPCQYDTIEIETWVECIENLTTTRNFRIYDSQKNVLGAAVSEWVMLDINTRRPKNLNSLKEMHNYATGETNTIEKPNKLQPAAGSVLDSFKVKYSAIDINIHTNSICYIEWICNCFSLEQYQRKQIKRFEINYISEILFNDQIAILGEEYVPDHFLFEIRKNDKAACRTKVIWIDRQTKALLS
jgi:acyl-ACP thioesterase